MKKLLLLSCIGLAMGTAAFGEDQSEMVEMQQLDSAAVESSRLSYQFDLWHETDKVRSSDNGSDVTDIGTSFKITDNETGLFFMYELLTTSITKDASERDRHNFRFGQNDMFTLGGFTVTPYYQFRYEDHSKGGTDERFQHRIGYSGSNDHGWSFWGYSSYDSFEGRASESGNDQSGYYGEHELLYSFDLGQGVMTTSVFNEYQTLTYSSFNNTQARAEYMHPMAEGFTMGPFTELDLHRRNSGRASDYNGKRGTKNTDSVYVAGVRANVTMSESWSAWNEVSWNFVESDDDVLYIETGLTYKF